MVGIYLDCTQGSRYHVVEEQCKEESPRTKPPSRRNTSLYALCYTNTLLYNLSQRYTPSAIQCVELFSFCIERRPLIVERIEPIGSKLLTFSSITQIPLFRFNTIPAPRIKLETLWAMLLTHYEMYKYNLCVICCLTVCTFATSHIEKAVNRRW